ncbi:phycobilisome degradation protein NblB [Leptolyngbya ohadii]|uniref:phycobilisome degradation protein NblB n=1 Tax=Leptolyngbya ohadii TaxID=1962290 RepID=UPI000B59B816|nr:HEAT repeat domain-containing protein [Leptolyngbya ohadii]
MSVTPESVQELLSSEDFGHRLSGVNQLRQLDPSIAFDLIQPVVIDRNVRVRYAAVSQLSSLGQQNPTAALEILKRALTEDPEPDVQAAAADSIGALKLTQAYEDLEQLYNRTSEWLVQFSVIAALGELGDPRSFTLLETALQSETELVRTAAIGSLGELGDDRAVQLLLPYISDPDWQTRYQVAKALSRFDSPEVRSALEQMSHDEMEAVAQEAQTYLAK